MQMLRIMLAVSMIACLAGCACIKSAFKEGKDVPLSSVPAAVNQAAVGVVKGLVLIRAEVEQEKGRTTYELKGKADGKEYKLEVTAEGRVIEFKELHD